MTSSLLVSPRLLFYCLVEIHVYGWMSLGLSYSSYGCLLESFAVSDLLQQRGAGNRPKGRRRPYPAEMRGGE